MGASKMTPAVWIAPNTLTSVHPEIGIFVQDQVEDPGLRAGAREKNKRRHMTNIPSIIF
jgi:hypothetical protein